MLSILMAVAAAAVFAVATVAQHRAAAAIPTHDVSAVQLILRLGRNRRWLLAKAADIVAFALHATALDKGSFIVVQSVLSVGIVLALYLEARFEGRRLARASWIGSMILLAGIVLLVGLGRPNDGRPAARLSQAVPIAIAVGALAAAALLATRRRLGARSGIALATMGGVCFALDASFVRTATHRLDRDGLGLSMLPGVIGFLACAIVGNILIQRAFQISSLRVTLPALTAIQPLAGLAFGHVLFDERLRHTLEGRLGGYGGMVVLALGVVITQLRETPVAPLVQVAGHVPR